MVKPDRLLRDRNLPRSDRHFALVGHWELTPAQRSVEIVAYEEAAVQQVLAQHFRLE